MLRNENDNDNNIEEMSLVVRKENVNITKKRNTKIIVMKVR